MTDKISYEWRIVHNGVGKTPNIRTNGTSWLYKNNIWLACGASAGYGKTAEVWRFSLETKEWNKVDVAGILTQFFLSVIGSVFFHLLSLHSTIVIISIFRWSYPQRWKLGHLCRPWKVCSVRGAGVSRTQQKVEQNVRR